ncbi:phosphoenolpyruvate synthase [Candidatus Woesearchaeota archaeon]|nr:phosphoenolpyruvate synthase [Candidatus Woesearchaeota archaeon]
MYRNLTKRGVKIPNGFAVTAYAYNHFIEKAGIKNKLKHILKKLDKSKKNLAEIGHEARQTILHSKLPPELTKEIVSSYKKLCRQYGANTDVAVRSSATAEDLPSISENSHVLIKINGKPIYDTIGNIYANFCDCEGIDLEVIAMKNNETKWVKAEQIYQHPAKNAKLYKIITETGREIEISEDHSLIVLDPESFKPKTASISKLKGNEMIPATRKIPLINSNIKIIDVLDYIDGKDVHEENDLVYIKNNSSNWKIQNPLRRFIMLDNDFAYFLGLYCAEGCTYKSGIILTNSDNKIIEKIKDFAKQLSIYNNQKINNNSLRVYCKGLVRFLNQVTGTPLNFKGKGRSCRIKRVPNFLFECNKKLIGSFLAGCFDGDGYISKGGVEYSSTSEQLIGGIVKLLEMLDFNLYLRRSKNSFTVTIPASEAIKFKENIPLENENKLNKLLNLIQHYQNKKTHPQFKNIINISDKLSELIKASHDKILEKQIVEAYFCPICDNKIEKTSYYKNIPRFYCKKCRKTLYEDFVIKINIANHINYDKKGRFKKSSVSWNKGLILGSISRAKFKKLMIKYGLNEYSNFFEKSVMWDSIKKIEEFDYNGMVYDFTVPNIENFAAGIGGIITHNSASFAGQQESFLNIRGNNTLLEACKKCFASLFTDRAISYRVDKHFDHFKIALSVGVQKMVRSDKACSGVMFSIDTETGFKDAVLINGAYGLGENVVQGSVNPDQFYVFKPMLKKGFKPIISKKLGSKKMKMVYSENGKKTTANIPVHERARLKYVLNDNEILKLAEWACIIEDYYSKKARKFKPMDMEWAKDGITHELFIVQARPETVQSQRNYNILEEYILKEKGTEIVKGLSVGTKIAVGKAHVIKDAKEIKRFRHGEVLITEKTDPDWEPIMKIASAIVTNKGGRTAHAAIVARELGIPAIVGTERGTEVVKTGIDVTVSCAEGEVGHVYKGKLKFEVHKINLKKLRRPKTMIMMNVGNPDQAFEFCMIPNDGVGLAREEFIISSYIKVHPLALLHFDRLKDKKAKEVIAHLTYSYKHKADFFVEKLAQGVAMIGAAFYPKDVIVRMSDFKTNEYANLIGGKEFEPNEENPMLGWRGASRYYAGSYREAFGLECMAMKKARDEMGLTNIKLMIPFCRTIEEGKEVIKEMEKYGLIQGKNNLEIYVMAEIPSNVILADEFAKIFDGFSIGSNDLTQLTLGLDRDSELVSRLYDERNPAVKKLIDEVIKKAKRNHRKIGICGQGPSDYPDFAEFLVECDIDSISLNPDTVIKTTMKILEVEKKLRR